MGLAICRSIIEAHDGRILGFAIRSRCGFPVCPEGKRMTGAIESDSTVFIVDVIDPAIRESLSDLLDSAGVRTCVYGSAEEFLSARNAAMAGCLLLDVRLPGMTGMELQTRLSGSRLRSPRHHHDGSWRHADGAESSQGRRGGVLDQAVPG